MCMSLFSATVLESVLNLRTHDRASAFNSFSKYVGWLNPDTQKPDQVWMRAIRARTRVRANVDMPKYNVVYLKISFIN